MLGRCTRTAVTLVVASVALIASISAVVEAPTAHAAPGPDTGAYFDSEQGDYLGAGQPMTFSSVVAQGDQMSPAFTVSNGVDSFVLTFVAPVGQPTLTPGVYENAVRASTPSATPGLDVNGDGRGCNTSAGRFVVDDSSYDGSGHVLTFAARFELHCNGNSPALFGFVSYNSAAAYRIRTISANRLQFSGSPGVAVSQTLTITNQGPATDTPTGFAISGPDASTFAVAATTCAGALTAGTSCSVTVRYIQQSLNQTASATLSFGDELAPLGSAGEPASAGSGRDITLSGVAGLGTIAGTVTGPGGVGVAHICVTLLDPASATTNGVIATTAADGTYVTAGLQPGSYGVYFFGGQNCAPAAGLTPYAPQIYNHASTAATATLVAVVGGQQTSGINAQLVVGGSISGRVTATSGAPLPQTRVTVAAVAGEPFFSSTVLSGNDGSYVVASLPMGAFSVTFTYRPTGLPEQIQEFDNVEDVAKATPVHVTVGATTAGVDATFSSTTGGKIDRLSGPDRFLTAVAVSQASYPAGGAGAVILDATTTTPTPLSAPRWRRQKMRRFS